MRMIHSLGALTALVVLGAAGVAAQPGGHMAMAPDTRQPLDFPAHMREHMLSNMRGHFVALQEILAALAAGDGAKASKIAKERLGLESPDAAACVKPTGASGNMTPMGDMAAMMAKYMPEQMRALGLAMHESASAFAVEAAKMPPGGDAKPALEALAQVTQNCAACHAVYRLR